MALFPLFVDLAGLCCLVVGGGTVGTRRVRALLDFEGIVHVIAPQPSTELREMAAAGRITLQQRHFQDDDLAGMDLVVAASDDRELNHRITAQAMANGLLANDASVPRPVKGAFAFPALVRRNELVIGVTSSGTDHGLVKRVRQNLESYFAAPAGDDEGRNP